MKKHTLAALYLALCLAIPAFATTLVNLVTTTLTATTATITRLTVGSLTLTTMTASGYSVTNATATVFRASTATLGAATMSLAVVNTRLVLTQSAVGTGGTGTTGVHTSTTIPVTTPFETVISSGLLILMAATPTVATTTAVSGPTALAGGTLLILTSTSATGGLIFQDEGTLTGSLLQLGAATRTVDQHNTLVLIFDSVAGYWKEIAFGAL